MKTEDLLLVLVAAGVTLTCFYMVVEFMSWQTAKASDHRARLVIREIYRKLHSRTKPYFARGPRRK